MSAAFHSCFSFIIYTCWPQSRWVCVLWNSCLPLECHAIFTLPQQFITKTWHEDYFKDHQHLEFTSWVLLIVPIVWLFVLGHCPVSQILPGWQQSTSFPLRSRSVGHSTPSPALLQDSAAWAQMREGNSESRYRRAAASLKPTRLYSPCQEKLLAPLGGCKHSMEINPSAGQTLHIPPTPSSGGDTMPRCHHPVPSACISHLIPMGKLLLETLQP